MIIPRWWNQERLFFVLHWRSTVVPDSWPVEDGHKRYMSNTRPYDSFQPTFVRAKIPVQVVILSLPIPNCTLCNSWKLAAGEGEAPNRNERNGQRPFIVTLHLSRTCSVNYGTIIPDGDGELYLESQLKEPLIMVTVAVICTPLANVIWQKHGQNG